MQIGGIGSGTANHKYFSLSVQGVATRGCNGLQWLVQIGIIIKICKMMNSDYKDLKMNNTQLLPWRKPYSEMIFTPDWFWLFWIFYCFRNMKNELLRISTICCFNQRHYESFMVVFFFFWMSFSLIRFVFNHAVWTLT